MAYTVPPTSKAAHEYIKPHKVTREGFRHTEETKEKIRAKKMGSVPINRKNLAGMAFGRLSVISYSHTHKKRTYWNCLCVCGNNKMAVSKLLLNGKTSSCGCLKVEQNAKLFVKHGHARSESHSPEFSAWQNMKARCYNPNNSRYSDWGGRGIRVCDRWINSFENFLADMGKKPTPNHSLDRFPNNDGDYEPSNCRWATRKEQASNTRRTKKQ